MFERVRSWLAPTSEEIEIAHQQALLNTVLFGLALPGFLFGIAMLVLWAMGRTPAAGAIAGIGVQPFYLLSYWLGRRGRVRLAGFIPVGMVFLIMAASMFIVGIGHVTLIGMAMVIAAAGVLIGNQAVALFIILSVISYFLAGYAQLSGLISSAIAPIDAIAADAIGLGLGLSVIAVILWLSDSQMHSSLQRERELYKELEIQREELESTVEERTQGLRRQALQLSAAADIAKLAAEATELDVLLSESIEIIRNQFGYYHASVFLMDSTGNWAELAASTGEAGRQLLARRHRLAVGSASIIGWSTANRLPRVASDVEEDPFHFKNPLLPDTRSEIALPLIAGKRLLGAIDVQSTSVNAFPEDELRAMEAIASELTVAIDRVRAQTEIRSELDRADQIVRQQLGTSWADYSRKKGTNTIYFTPTGERLLNVGVDFPGAPLAIQHVKTVSGEDGREVSVPIQLRGEVIATISARKREPNQRWSEEEIAMIEAVASQTSLALESARQRSEEHRRVSELEVINRVSQAVSQMLRLDSLFRVVHRQVNQVIGETDMFVGLYNEDKQTIEFPYAYEKGASIDLPEIAFGEGLTSQVVRTKQPLLLGSADLRNPEKLGAQQVGKAALSWLGVPLMLGDQVVGVLAIKDSSQASRFSDEDAALMTTIASQVTAAIQNSRLLNQVQRTARRQRLIHEITSKVRRSPDMKSVLETTARELGRALNAVQTSVELETDASELEQDAVDETNGDGLTQE